MADEVPPWARDVPAGPPPEFPDDWHRAGSGEPDALAAGNSAPSPRYPDQPDEIRSSGAHERSTNAAGGLMRHGRALLALVIVGAGLVAAGIVASIGDGSGSSPPDAAPSASTPGSSSPSSPGSSSPSSPGSSSPSSSEPFSVETTEATTPDDPAADLPTGGATVRAGEPRASAWAAGTIDLFPSLSAISVPTEVVALTASGTLHVIELPSGDVRSIDVGRSGRRVDLILAERSIVLDRFDVQQADLVTRLGDVVSLDVALGAWSITPRPATDEFLVAATSGLDARSSRYTLDAAGGLVEISGAAIADFDPSTSFFTPSGELVVADSGGLYRVGLDGGPARRVSDGEPMVAGTDALLVRSCDEFRRCGHELLDLSSFSLSPASIGSAAAVRRPPDVEWPLAADASALAFVDVMAEEPIWRIVELQTGEEFDVARPGSPDVGAAWAADASGLFTVEGDRLVFYDRALGGLLPVGDFDRVVAVAARPVAPERAVVPRLSAPSGIELVGLTVAGDVVRLSLDSGEFHAADESLAAVLQPGDSAEVGDIAGSLDDETLITGDLLAAGSGHAYTRECSPDICATYRVVTADGRRERLVNETLKAARPAAVAIGSSVSPDGGAVVLELIDGWLILDTRTGQLTPIPAPDADSPVVWSVDGRVAAFLGDQRLYVYDRLVGRVDVVGAVPALRVIAAG